MTGSSVVRPARTVGVLGACASLALMFAASGASAETRGYAISLIHTATYSNKDNCPQGGNGGAQAIIDAATLARLLAEQSDPIAALRAYEDIRLPATSRIVLQNRTAPPNVIVDTVEQRTGGKRFERLEDVISQDELRGIFERYQKVAGYHVQQVGKG